MTSMRHGPSGSPSIVVALLALVAVILASGTVAASGLSDRGGSAHVAPATASVTVNITATGDLSFVPSSFTVLPGETVHLIVTQAADFEHTFTLSSLANFTIPSTDSPSELAAFFNAHAPLVNLSLGSTAGTQHTANFTAPATMGTYEFVCLIHFPQMIGVMTDSSASPSTSGGGGLSVAEIVGIGAGVAVVVIAAVVLVVRRRRPAH